MMQDYIANRDGTRLFLQVDSPENPEAVVVVVHGLCEHCGRYDHLADRLTWEGYSVYRFDHRGHGRSDGKRVYYDQWFEISDDVFDIVQLAKDENPGKKIVVLGHSMGGYAVTCFATRFPDAADAIVLSGALTRYHHRLAGELPIAAPADLYVPNALGEGVCSDPEVIKAYVEDPLVAKEMSIGLLNSIYAGIEYLKNNAARFEAPVLILHGANDGLVSPQDSIDLYNSVSSEDKGLCIYPRLCHEIFNEPIKDKVIDDVLFWLKERI